MERLCEYCGNQLTGMQIKYCSKKCGSYASKERNLERVKGRQRNWTRNWRSSNRERHAKVWRSRDERIKRKLFLILGQDSCMKCGFSDKRALQFDHINGGGNKDIKTLTYYVNHPEEARQKLQVLCANCNRIKVIENKEFAWKHPPV